MNVWRLPWMSVWALGLAAAGCWASAPVHPEAERLNRLGVTCLQAGRLDQAEAALSLSVEYNPCFADAWHNLALVAFGRSALDEAERCEQQALACRPDLVQAINGLGVVAQLRGRLADAEEYFEAALELDPGCLDARRNLIRVARDLGDTDLASQERARLRVLSPDDAGLLPPGRGR